MIWRRAARYRTSRPPPRSIHPVRAAGYSSYRTVPRLRPGYRGCDGATVPGAQHHPSARALFVIRRDGTILMASSGKGAWWRESAFHSRTSGRPGRSHRHCSGTKTVWHGHPRMPEGSDLGRTCLDTATRRPDAWSCGAPFRQPVTRLGRGGIAGATGQAFPAEASGSPRAQIPGGKNRRRPAAGGYYPVSRRPDKQDLP